MRQMSGGSRRERRDDEGLVLAGRRAVHGGLVRGGVGARLVPHAHHVLAAQPVRAARRQADGPRTLGTGEVLRRHAHRPAQQARLAHDLVEHHLFRGPADAGDGLHLRAALEALHADGNRLEAQEAVQPVNDRLEVQRGAGGRRSGRGGGGRSHVASEGGVGRHAPSRSVPGAAPAVTVLALPRWNYPTARSGAAGGGSRAGRAGSRSGGRPASRYRRSRIPNTPTATAGSPTCAPRRWCG